MFDSNNGIRYYVMAVMVGGDNVLGVIVGQSPKVSDNSIVTREDNDTSFHLEGLYKMKIVWRRG